MPVTFSLPQMGEVVDGAVVVAVEMGETALDGVVGPLVMPEVPFADAGAALLAGFREDFGEGLLGKIEAKLSPGRDHSIAQAEAVRVAAGEEPSPGGRADRADIEAVKLNT